MCCGFLGGLLFDSINSSSKKGKFIERGGEKPAKMTQYMLPVA